jgi:hypothetical protein
VEDVGSGRPQATTLSSVSLDRGQTTEEVPVARRRRSGSRGDSFSDFLMGGPCSLAATHFLSALYRSTTTRSGEAL